MQSLWTHRNNVVFYNSKSSGIKVFMMIQIKIWTWIINKYPKAFFSYSNWCLCLTMCSNLFVDLLV